VVVARGWVVRVTAGVDGLAALIAGADRILIFTGAGVSTASGIPDYRGPQGVWNTRRPVMYHDFMRSAEARARYWRQKLEDHREFGVAAPNAAHRAIADLEAAGKVELVVTQNVDGLHEKAGTSRERLVEIHGSVAWVECQACGELTDPDQHFETFEATGSAPECACGGYLKSATISFGQNLRMGDVQRAVEAAESADLVVALGSSLVVFPAADIPLQAARRGVPYAIVNRGETGHDRNPLVALRIEGDVTEIVPEAAALVLER
jgi:NAD-dependent deacetylase